MNKASISRYPGVAPFRMEQSEVFFGREEDAQRLYQLLQSENQVLLYAKSGLGKSSLIHAGLKPKLQNQNQWQSLDIRFQAWTEGSPSPLVNLQNLLPEKTTANYLDKIIPQENSLWYRFKSQQSDKNETILLIFDQFEELFSYPEAEIFSFKKQLAEVLYSQVPNTFRRVLEKKQAQKPNLFSEAELTQLYRPLRIKILVAIREDRLSNINQLADFLPDMRRNYLEIKALDRTQVRAAIIKPAQKEGNFSSPPFRYTEEALGYILDFLTQNNTQAVETTQLQILCNTIENLHKGEITLADIPNFEDIFLDFYNSITQKTPNPAQTRLFIENQLVRKGQRISLDEKLCTDYLPLTVIKQLENEHLIRAERNSTGGISYELSHDTLIAPVTEAKTLREAKEAQEKAEQDRLEEERRLKEQAEKDRQEKLKVQKQLRTTRLLLAAAVLALLIAVLSVFYALELRKKAKTSEENAKKALRISEKAEKKAQQSLQALKTEKAKAFAAQARNFLNMQEYEIAKANLDSAKKYDKTLPDLQEIEKEF
ncbi:MAG: hypothetical protein NW226_00515 [Microscillaceae bacterium]|nr:hypothetical protein [Microscillaceae bacterium]